MSRAAFTLSLALGLALATLGCNSTPTTDPSASTPPASTSVYKPLPVEAEFTAAQASNQRGKAASDFSIPNQDDQTVQLAALRGKWVVLYFYPKDDTPGCTCQATEFTHILTDFNNLDAVIMGVSPDSPASHRFFRAKYDIKIPLLSDQDHKVAQAYNAWKVTNDPKPGAPAGRIIRSTYLIDPQGRVAYHWPQVVPQGHAQRVHAKLAELATPAAASAR